MMSKYNDISIWKDAYMEENFGEELTENSIFIYTSDCMPHPCCASSACVNWFNDIAILTGYIKYMVLNRVFSLVVDLEEPINENIELAISKAVENGIITKEDADHMNEVYAMIDKCFDNSSVNTYELLNDCIATFNAYFGTIRGFDFSAKLFKGLDELKPFVCDYFENSTSYSNEDINRLFDDYSSIDFEEMLAEIIS